MEKTVSSISGAGKTAQLHVNNEIRIFPYIIHKNKLKMDLRLKCKTGNHKSPIRKPSRTLFDISHSNIYKDLCPKTKKTKANIDK